VLGSFALGVVVGALADRHPLARAFVGTGVLGGFTTYSAFALHTATLLAPAPIAAVALAVLSVLLGLLAAALGLRLARRGGAAGPVPETPR
jgi:CrcB protein